MKGVDIGYGYTLSTTEKLILLKLMLYRWSGASSLESYPNTPQPMYPMHDGGMADPPSVGSNAADCGVPP